MTEPNSKVVTRFAPSPTGALHVGGARTALFNWAFARKHGGQFILRIEDTDQTRSTDESVTGILDDMAWLGIDWDQGPDPADPANRQIGDRGPYFQSQRLDIYKEHLQRLIDAGLAYDDGGAMRFRTPDHDLTIDDAVLGEVTVKCADLEDFIIMKSDGFPTYHFAVVIDDALMGATHVLRGQEHLSNSHKHAALLDALGLERPTWAHIPLIFNMDSSKMSKRDKAKTARKTAKEFIQQNDMKSLVEKLVAADWIALLSNEQENNLLDEFVNKKNDEMRVAKHLADALSITLPEIEVADFRASGYLPGALLNYLALLGWSPGDDIEKFDRDFLVERFDLSRCGKSNSKFDREKLFRFNADAIAELPTDEFKTQWRSYAEQFQPELFAKVTDERFDPMALAYHQRSRTLAEPLNIGRFLIENDDDIEYDEKAVKKNLKKNDGEGFGVLKELRSRYADCDPWSGDAAHKVVHDLAEEMSIKMGKVAQPLRVAVSGSTVSPPIDQTLEILGKSSTLARIDRCLTLQTAAAE